MTDRKKAIEEMKKALRANCHVKELLDELPFDLYGANMVYHGYGNIEQALTEFAEKLKSELIPDYLHAADPLIANGIKKAIYRLDETLKEFLKP